MVGENESAEYFRQSKTIVEHWAAAGIVTRFGAIPNANHFTAIAPLADPESPMTLRLKELAARQFPKKDWIAGIWPLAPNCFKYKMFPNDALPDGLLG